MGQAQFKTLTDLVADARGLLRRYPGSGAQLYSDDAIAKAIRDAYVMFSEERWYTFQMKWFPNIALDGTTGIPTSDFTNVQRFADIRAVFVANVNRPLPTLPANMNPYQWLSAGSVFLEELNTVDEPSATSNRLFRVWPLSTSQNLWVYARVRPANIFTDPDVRVNFDDIALTYKAAFDIATDDGSNPAQIDKFQTMFTSRIDQLQKQEHNQPILLDPRFPNGVNGELYFEVPYS